MRSAPSELSIECPPSMPMSDAILPCLKMRSMSSAVSASSNAPGYLRIMRCTMSICSSVEVTGATSSAATYTDQN